MALRRLVPAARGAGRVAASTLSAAKADVLERSVQLCRDQDIILPTFDELINPELVPEGIKSELESVDLWGLKPRNLFRITWKNEPVPSGGGFGGVNYMELPPELTGVKARLFVMLGKYFPTGAHKVGATYGPLVSRLTTGEFDPTYHLALWPSTGNYCRGGAYDSYLLGIKPVAVLPEEMSAERFEWLKSIGAEVHATPGCESNVKEVFDKSAELDATRPEIIVMNQFCDFTNPLFHYHATGRAMEEVFTKNAQPGQRFSGIHLTQGSAGTLAAGDYLKDSYPLLKLGVGEALQCPTLLYNGYGGHRIEGIGDKHVPFVHNLKSTDMVIDLDDEACMRTLRVFNEPAGQAMLEAEGVAPELISKLHYLGISGVANVLGLIKMAKYYEWTEQDVGMTVATDSMDLYGSRLLELREEHGDLTEKQAARDYDRHWMGTGVDNLLECNHYDRKRMHHLKYFTWVEQQGKTVEELDAQWYQDDYWTSKWAVVDELNERINEFNDRVGLLKKY